MSSNTWREVILTDSRQLSW